MKQDVRIVTSQFKAATERRGRVELRWQENADGSLDFDEFLVYDDAGKCIVHGEAMSDGDYWIACYTGLPDQDRATMNFHAVKKGRMDMTGDWNQ